MSTPAALHWQVFTSPTRPIGDGRATFSPITSTMIYSQRELVLIDAQFVAEDVAALGDALEETGRTLTTIVITHGHGDHWFGSDTLMARFPGASLITTQGVVDYLNAHLDADIAWMTALFGDRIRLPTTRPRALEGDELLLEGHQLRLIEVGQGDIAPGSIVHVPELDLVAAGDIAYNNIHPMLAFGGPAEWDRWITSIEVIETLAPHIVIAGHKAPGALDDAVADILGGTKAYIGDFAAAAASATSAAGLVATMQDKYPQHGNLTTLRASAAAAVQARDKNPV